MLMWPACKINTDKINLPAHLVIVFQLVLRKLVMAVQLWSMNPGWLVSVAQCVLFQGTQISMNTSLALDEIAVVCTVVTWCISYAV